MRIWVVVGALAVMVGCVQNTALTVELVIPAEVMAAIPVEDYPQQVGFGTDMHDGVTWSVCVPSDTDLVITLEDDTDSCVQSPLEVRALMGPFVPPSTGCVDERADPYNALSAGTIVAEGLGTAFDEANDATCITREDSIQIELALSGA
ncbi:MAG: hypothetical protein EP330_30540 [Deltaproteobacteria bacterium]|nr:MAG: hypothetical protein EP330_30540 [Deltaproteobacteria bacterium]